MAVTLKIIEKQPCAGLLPTIRKYVTLGLTMTSETQTNRTMSMTVVENLAPNDHADLHQDDVDADFHHNSHHNHHHIDFHQDDVDARDREPRVQ